MSSVWNTCWQVSRCGCVVMMQEQRVQIDEAMALMKASSILQQAIGLWYFKID